MDDQIWEELTYRQVVVLVVDGFLAGDMPTESAARTLTNLFPAGEADWHAGCCATMTMILQDVAEHAAKRDKIVAGIVAMIVETWHEVRTGESVMAAAAALVAQGRTVLYSDADNQFFVDGKGPFSHDDIIDQASSL